MNKRKSFIAVILAAMMFCISTVCGAQTVTGKFSSSPLKDVLEKIQNQTGYTFIYDYSDIDLSRHVTATFKNAPLAEVLDKVLDPSLKYSVSGKIISISRQPVAQRQNHKSVPERVTVSGTVISATDNQPLIGAGVVIDNTTTGTVTDVDGNFTISIPSDAKTVTFSCLGYQSREISAKDAILMRLVSLSEENTTLENAVVVGFGVQKKESVVGAVQAIRPADLSYPSSNLTTSFAGKIAGVISTQRSGEPGADGANFWIRGISTFGTNTSDRKSVV